MPTYLFSQQPVLLGSGGNGISIGARDSTAFADIAAGTPEYFYLAGSMCPVSLYDAPPLQWPPYMYSCSRVTLRYNTSTLTGYSADNVISARLEAYFPTHPQMYPGWYNADGMERLHISQAPPSPSEQAVNSAEYWQWMTAAKESKGSWTSASDPAVDPMILTLSRSAYSLINFGGVTNMLLINDADMTNTAPSAGSNGLNFFYQGTWRLRLELLAGRIYRERATALRHEYDRGKGIYRETLWF